VQPVMNSPSATKASSLFRFIPASQQRKISAQPMTSRILCQVDFGSFAPASSLGKIIDFSKF
jgi:hypothetical protein